MLKQDLRVIRVAGIHLITDLTIHQIIKRK